MWLCVLETCDSRCRRRCPSLGCVRVRRTTIVPGPKLDAHVRASKKLINLGVRCVRYDLMPNDSQLGGRLRPFLVAEHARKAESDLRNRLLGLGYTVNGNTTVWSVYVIELDDQDSATGKSSGGFVYVGQTSLTVEERVRQHFLGPEYKPNYTKYSRICHKRFRQLRMDLLPTWARCSFFTKCDALRAEGRLRLHFEKQGYRVEGGTELLGDKPHAECGSLRR